MSTQYARTQGVKLLEGIIQEVGPLFSFNDALKAGRSLGLSRQKLRNTLSHLSQSGWVARLKRGLYAVNTPLFGEDIHPFAVAQALVEPSAISHWSALAHHGLTTQIPPMVQVSTPRKVVTPEMRTGEAYQPRGRAAWKVLEFEFEYIHVKPEKFWGFINEWVSDWHRVRITDPERTLLDMIARSDLYGGITVAIETIETHINALHVEKLVEYALRYDVGSVIKRLGWILESNHVSGRDLDPLSNYPVNQNYYLLDPQGRNEGRPIAHWNLYRNLPEGNNG